MIGQTISHYKILEKLGEGGMGVVYKAEDLKLQRAVALKILPREALVTEQDRTRFAREAQAAASLNHPNIAMIHEFDEVEDASSQGKLAFIAMEFVDGETLKQKTKDHPLPIKDLINISIATAEGLTKAHEKGIVHRDIKSDNIMISTDGVVKITDFGLAELPGRTRVTKEGTTVGTVAYMSPEQTLGEKLDRRTDIWSLGVVLYEIITGRLPFGGDYDQAILYKVLNEEPEPITSLRSNVPMELERIVSKALMKNREERYQHADDILADLRVLRKGSSSVSLSKTRTQTRTRIAEQVAPSEATKKTTRSPLRNVWALGTILFFITSVLLAALYFTRPSVELPRIRGVIRPPLGMTLARAYGGNIALSPDGKRIAFVTDAGNKLQLWIQSVDASSAQPLAGTDQAHYPFWSPDGRQIGFFTLDKLKRIDVSGGSPVTICEAKQGRGATWNQDGVIVFAPESGGGLSRVSASGGIPTPLTKLDSSRQELTHRWPHFLPDGEHFLYFAYNGPGSVTNAVFVGSLSSADVKFLSPAQSNVTYANGCLLYVHQNALMARPFDAKALEFKGEPFLVSEKVHYEPGFARADFSASQTKILTYRGGDVEVLSRLAISDRRGKILADIEEPSMYFNARFSPNGQKVAVEMFDFQARRASVWIQDVRRSTRTQITLSESNNRSPIWSPDGNYVAFASDRTGQLNIYRKSTRDGTEEELLKSEHAGLQPTDWSPDGRYIVFQTEVDPSQRRDIFLLPLFGDHKPLPLVSTKADEFGAQFSPDGRWVAYVSDESGDPEVFVRPIEGRTGRFQVSTAGAAFPRWRGNELIFVQQRHLVYVEVKRMDTVFEASVPKRVFEADQGPEPEVKDISIDGKAFLVSRPAEKETSPIILLVNWLAEK